MYCSLCQRSLSASFESFYLLFKAQEKIKMIQEKYMSRADEINEALVKKHEAEQMKLIEQKLEAERALKIQTKEMTSEIERLQKVT